MTANQALIEKFAGIKNKTGSTTKNIDVENINQQILD